MTGVITSLPPLVEQPPGSNASNPAGLPGLTYTVAVLGIAQTWTAKQTFPAGNISLTYTDVIGLSPSASVDTTNAANITSGTLPAARLPNPSASTLGGVQSAAAVSHNWISSISTSGVPVLSQPAFADISGTISAAQIPANVVTNAMRAQMAAYTLKGNATGSTANEADIDITALTAKATPVAADVLLIQDSAASFGFKKATLGSLPSGGGNVVGPGSATANGFAVYNGTTGTLIKDHAATIALGSEVSGTLPVANGGTGNTGGAWTSWTPTVTSGGGTPTTVSAAGSYQQVGKLVNWCVSITVTAVGTANSGINITMPGSIQAVRASAGTAYEANLTGKSGAARILAASSTMAIWYYDNTTMWASGALVIASGSYEAS